MADDDLPGFIEDEPKKPAAKAAKPAAAAPAAAAFNPFGDVKVTLDPTAAPATAAEPTAKGPAKPGTGRTARPPAAGGKPLPAPVADAGDADIAPGQGRDLWLCPHCSAKNKPGRETCRSCGKSPDEPVEAPWHADPKARLGIAAGGALVILLLGWLLFGGGDVALKPADAAHADRKLRYGGKSDASAPLGGGAQFVGKRRVGVCGRVLASVPGPHGAQQVALALGASTSDATFPGYVVDTSAGISITPEPDMKTLYLLFGDVGTPALEKGAWLSLVGDAGTVEDAGAPVHDVDDGVVIRVEAIEQR